MEENKIPTASEFMEDYLPRGINYVYPDLAEGAVEFAKLHVKRALEAAAENAKAFHQYPWTHNEPYVDVHSVTSAYPESNIQ
jgi:hypothetical protein